MTPYEILSSSISIVAVIVSGLAAWFTYKNLKEIKNQFFEQNRGNAIFYIDKIHRGEAYTLVLKNYGHSPVKILSISIDPEIDWAKSNLSVPSKCNFSNCKNVFIAPQRFISSDFIFRNYPDETFKITLEYETCGKIFKETYDIDLSFTHNLIETKQSPKNEIRALQHINESIQQLSDRFL